MRIEKIEWRNIFSYGNKLNVLEFSDKGMLWQVSGKSGCGKTSLLTMPKLLLYGKTEGSNGKAIKVGSIANRINKHGWIRGTIVEGKDTYVIERTFSPQSLKVWKNGVDLDKAGLKDMQGIIDNEILDNMPYHIFANVMTVSLNNFKSFISMSPADKRLIIDKIFNLEILNKVAELIKKDKKDVGDIINLSNSKLFAYEQSIISSNKQLASMEEKNTNDNSDLLKTLKGKIEITKNLYSQQSTLYTDEYKIYTELKTAESELNTVKYNHSTTCNTIQKQLKLFGEDKCPTCGTSFNSAEFDDIRASLETKYKEAYDLYVESENALKKLNETITNSCNSLNAIKQNMDKIIKKQNELLVEVRSIEKAATLTDEFTAIQNIIAETQANKSLVEKEIQECNTKMGLLSVMEKLYSSDGIKKQLMENYIPTLNDEIANTLSFLNFPYTLEFDNNFDPHLESLGEQIDPQSLSIGEHKKVDLTVLCAVLRMLKRTYPQINLVCLDETLSSLDYESSTDIISYLKEIASNMGLNIFIVSHTQLEESMFDRRLYIDKNSGFSDVLYL